jgi:hypothetical protein
MPPDKRTKSTPEDSFKEGQLPEKQSTKQPTKKWLYLVIFLLILVLVGAGILGFLYYRSHNQNKKLNEDLSQLQAAQDLSTPSPTPESEDLDAKVELYEEKLNEALLYSSVFGYLNSLITKHSGLDGWTDQEYAEGRAMAAKTGDSGFLDTLDWAWQNEQISQETRLFSVLVEIQDGIHQALRGALYP